MFPPLNGSSQCAVVIPCFNEEQAISSVVQSARLHVPTVFVIDDGSTDRTVEMATQAGATIVQLEQNAGKGAALQRGLQRATDLEFAFAITMDGDGQHLGSDLPRFLTAAAQGSADMVIGNRMSDTAPMPWVRRTVNRWMSRRISQLANQDLPDTQCGFRLIRLSCWQGTPCVSTGFEIESEMLFSFVRNGHSIRFVPVATVYKSERSKIHPVRDTLRWFNWWRSVRQHSNAKFVLAAGVQSKTSSPEHVRSTT